MAKSKSVSVADILKALEKRAPSDTAEDWDNVGLLAGDPKWTTKGAIISIDLTAEAIKAAKAKGYKLIINHHPCIFPRSRGLSRVTPPSLVYEALQAGIAVAACHTNFDQSALEVVSSITEELEITPMGRLHDSGNESFYKLVVFVPTPYVERVRKAITEAGAGHIGQYDSCTFGVAGKGTFRGSKDTHPFLGKPGVLEEAQEVRLETILPRGLKKPILQALLESHPYEEVAYDLYALEQGPSKQGLVSGLGYGFWGEFKRARSFPDVAQSVKSLFNIDGFWVTHPTPSKVKRVAFVAGKGSSFLRSASQAGCELFITGEAGYHTALEGSRGGMAVMELGHRESEKFFLKTMKDWISAEGIQSATIDVPTQRIWSGGKK